MTDTVTTQKQAIADYLMLGLPLTPLDAWKLFGCSKLSTRIGELVKEKRIPSIDKKWVTVKARFGNTDVIEYRIPHRR